MRSLPLTLLLLSATALGGCVVEHPERRPEPAYSRAAPEPAPDRDYDRHHDYDARMARPDRDDRLPPDRDDRMAPPYGQPPSRY